MKASSATKANSLRSQLEFLFELTLLRLGPELITLTSNSTIQLLREVSQSRDVKIHGKKFSSPKIQYSLCKNVGGHGFRGNARCAALPQHFSNPLSKTPWTPAHSLPHSSQNFMRFLRDVSTPHNSCPRCCFDLPFAASVLNHLS